MTDDHEFFPQPDDRPPWCFCRHQDCPGWTAYMAWHQAGPGGNGEPSDEVIESHRLMAKLVTELPRYYSALLGTPVDLKTALELASIDRAAELRG
jgi:hypothetical protein